MFDAAMSVRMVSFCDAPKIVDAAGNQYMTVLLLQEPLYDLFVQLMGQSITDGFRGLFQWIVGRFGTSPGSAARPSNNYKCSP